VSDAALRLAEREAPGTERHAAALARVGRWREAEALYRRLRDEATEALWSVNIERQSLPISETRGPTISDRARALRNRAVALHLDARRLSRARIEAERNAAAAAPKRRARGA
jgi:hypothetical protein